jgi:RNA 3'-terminal phosphate cyclase
MEARCATLVLGAAEARGRGGAIVIWGAREDTVLGAGRVAERGVAAEALGVAVADEILDDLSAGATLDVHAADQLLIYLALARGTSRFATRELTPHARTAIWLVGQFLSTRFSVAEVAGGARVTVVPEGRS